MRNVKPEYQTKDGMMMKLLEAVEVLRAVQANNNLVNSQIDAFIESIFDDSKGGGGAKKLSTDNIEEIKELYKDLVGGKEKEEPSECGEKEPGGNPEGGDTDETEERNRAIQKKKDGSLTARPKITWHALEKHPF